MNSHLRLGEPLKIVHAIALRRAPSAPCVAARLRYNPRPFLFLYRINIMEAEQLNQVTNQLQDLRQRSEELRRYL